MCNRLRGTSRADCATRVAEPSDAAIRLQRDLTSAGTSADPGRTCDGDNPGTRAGNGAKTAQQPGDQQGKGDMRKGGHSRWTRRAA